MFLVTLEDVREIVKKTAADYKAEGIKVDNSCVDSTTLKDPVTKAWFANKSDDPNEILLVRHGDYYDTFAGDATRLASIIGLVLLQTDNLACTFLSLWSLEEGIEVCESEGIKVKIVEREEWQLYH